MGILMRLIRQFAGFSSVGIVAAVVHYTLLIALVQTELAAPVKANVVSYVFGGFVSYSLNRRLIFKSERAHVQAAWRFATVATVGILLTWVFTYVLHEHLRIPYILAAVLTSSLILFWNFIANRIWTFGQKQRA
jgi:putative flippase GtrA